MEITTLRRNAARIAVASIVAAGLSAVALPAHAAVTYQETDNSAYAYHLDPANEIDAGAYTVTWSPASRSGVSDLGVAAEKEGPGTLTTSTGCPVDYRASSRTFIVTPTGGFRTGAITRTGTGANYGLGGNGMNLIGVRASSWAQIPAEQFPNGVNAYVITCDPATAAGGKPSESLPVGNAKYFVTYLEVDRQAHSWKTVARPAAPVEKTATTTTLVASGTTENSTTLTATVAPATATGTVQFTQNGVNVGSPAVVTNGTASYSVSNLAPSTTFAFGAVYSGDTTHETSTGTASATTLTPVVPVDTSNTEIGVVVPTEAVVAPTGLKISTKPATAVTLTGTKATRNEGEAWTATGSLGDVTVTDDRQKDTAAGGVAWTLSGAASDFTTGSATFDSVNLSWTPAEVGNGPGSAGAAATGLKASKTLATGPATATKNAATTVKADLSLTVPAGTAPGNYKSTLTLTLV